MKLVILIHIFQESTDLTSKSTEINEDSPPNPDSPLAQEFPYIDDAASTEHLDEENIITDSSSDSESDSDDNDDKGEIVVTRTRSAGYSASYRDLEPIREDEDETESGKKVDNDGKVTKKEAKKLSDEGEDSGADLWKQIAAAVNEPQTEKDDDQARHLENSEVPEEKNRESHVSIHIDYQAQKSPTYSDRHLSGYEEIPLDIIEPKDPTGISRFLYILSQKFLK